MKTTYYQNLTTMENKTPDNARAEEILEKHFNQFRLSAGLEISVPMSIRAKESLVEAMNEFAAQERTRAKIEALEELLTYGSFVQGTTIKSKLEELRKEAGE